jgi:hypothetical protein
LQETISSRTKETKLIQHILRFTQGEKLKHDTTVVELISQSKNITSTTTRSNGEGRINATELEFNGGAPEEVAKVILKAVTSDNNEKPDLRR